ncbi:SxtJ family membrane protein [Rheinheimera baltica]|uniref:SxtJ family membrane protein n=2 Tax=Rheinheimera baltica TaxID=67576 RepID=A0ABT9HXB9_9GAMM|nr:SxtJ family membrane protein [Rheinheimera baltica]MDP5135778.1 SxtJ family membrane protein [Rheinheimera baltica]MDP5150752.1 SxtJ family membrane protein [Rheinheimera baltica]
MTMSIAANDTQALRRFGWQMMCAWPVMFGLVLPWLFNADWPLWPWLLGGVFAVFAILVPQLLYWPARLWFSFAHIMGWVNTRLILALLFFVVITPLGLVLRLLGKLDYKPQLSNADTYWRQSEDISADNMKDPF